MDHDRAQDICSQPSPKLAITSPTPGWEREAHQNLEYLNNAWDQMARKACLQQKRPALSPQHLLVAIWSYLAETMQMQKPRTFRTQMEPRNLGSCAVPYFVH